MTEKEAIIEIREKIIPMYNSPALELAIAALEKQIPKRITRYKWSISKCPCCNAELGEWLEDGYHRDYDHLKVCNCGQRLDWNYPEKCESCEKELEDDETVWITRHYPVCQECYDDLMPEEITEIIEVYG